jgi:RNA polymerase sigma-70 factor (ECF subfamily)
MIEGGDRTKEWFRRQAASEHHDLLQVLVKEDVQEVLLRLPEISPAPLVLRCMDGFATKEIARVLDASRWTILARLQRRRSRSVQELWAYA